MDGIILAFQLFSRIPIKKQAKFSKENLNIALSFLPIVGLVIGGLTGIVVNYFSEKSNFLAGALGLISYIVISGGMHLDGLSDTFDGFYSNAPKEKILDIMKDSLIGTFGTLSLIAYCLLKFSLYGSFEEDIVLSIAMASFVSRIAVLHVIKKGALSRPGGFGASMKEAIENSKLIYINIIFLLVFAYIDIRVIYASVISLLMAEIILYISNKKIAGVTGDVYGASIEINEIISLLVIWWSLWI